MSNDGTVTAAVKYTDASGNVRYCNLKVSDYKFDVRFLRPISLDPLDDTVIEDATSSVDQTQIIKLDELVNGFTDFRGNELATPPVVNWKSPAALGGLDYEEYYSPDGTNKFTVTVQNDVTELTMFCKEPEHIDKLQRRILLQVFNQLAVESFF